MKNNISIALNVVLFLALALLYVLFFRAQSGKQNQLNPISSSEFTPENTGIAYVNSDSLLANYLYFKELETQFNEKREKYDTEYRNRAQGLQSEFENFQRTANNMTMAQARAVQEDLQRKQQNLMMYQEQLTQELVVEEGRMTSELYDKVADYLRKFGQERNLQLVLTYSKGSGVLYANDSLDITRDVIQGLNTVYEAGKAAGDQKRP